MNSREIKNTRRPPIPLENLLWNAGKFSRTYRFTWYWLPISFPFSQSYTTWCLLVRNVKGDRIQLSKPTKNCTYIVRANVSFGRNLQQLLSRNIFDNLRKYYVHCHLPSETHIMINHHAISIFISIPCNNVKFIIFSFQD